MNREEAENLVIEATRRSDKLSLIRSALNLGLEQVSAVRTWSDLMTSATVVLTESSASVDLASDVARIIEIRVMDDSQSKPLLVRPKTWLISRVPDPSSRSEGRPCYGYLEGQTLFVVPYPDDDYDLDYTYYRLHPALAAATDEILIRAAASAVVAYATFWTFRSIEKHDDANQWFDTYTRSLEAAKRVDRTNPVTIYQADQHQDQAIYPNEYWLDPFFGVPR